MNKQVNRSSNTVDDERIVNDQYIILDWAREINKMPEHVIKLTGRVYSIGCDVVPVLNAGKTGHEACEWQCLTKWTVFVDQQDTTTIIIFSVLRMENYCYHYHYIINL